MATEPLGDVIRRMGRLPGLQTALSQTDAQLLDHFVARRDEPAFAALMVRHGPMVLCLCRQMLRDVQEAEDAFQAAFLVLARNAGSIRKRPSLSAWLYGVAYKVAARLRGRSERRRTRERPGFDLTSLPAAGEAINPDLRPVMHEEIRRLPEKYRAPVVLCYLEGKTNEEAAEQLSWPVGTVKARLSRARDMLRSRLARRDMGAAAALAPARNIASVLPIFLIESTLRERRCRSGRAGRHAVRQGESDSSGGAGAVRAGGRHDLVLGAHPGRPAGRGGRPGLSGGKADEAASGADFTSYRQISPIKKIKRPGPPKAKPAGHCSADVCKLDAMQRLRELVEQILLGPHKEKVPGLMTEPRSGVARRAGAAA